MRSGFQKNQDLEWKKNQKNAIQGMLEELIGMLL